MTDDRQRTAKLITPIRVTVHRGRLVCIVVRVLVVDDHPLLLVGLSAALHGVPGIDLVGEAGNADDAVVIARQFPIDVAILDIMMPRTSGLVLAVMLQRLQPDCRVLAFSANDDPSVIASMFKASASGFVVKSQPISELIEAVHAVCAGARYLPPGVSRTAVDAELASVTVDLVEQLSKREHEVFQLVIVGQTNDEIATRLFISRRTVETHRQRIVRKLHTRSLAQMQRLHAHHLNALVSE